MGSLMITLIIGGIIGWLASMLMRANGQMGILANVIVGIVGSYLGVAIADAVGVRANAAPAVWIVAILGAAVLIGLLRALNVLSRSAWRPVAMENEMSMSVAKVSDIISELTKTASAAVHEAIADPVNRGNGTLRNLRIWWVKDERVTKGAISEYQVNMMIGFVIDD